VHQLVIKLLNIIDARCNHEAYFGACLHMRLLLSMPASYFPGALFLTAMLRVICRSSFERHLPVFPYCCNDETLSPYLTLQSAILLMLWVGL